MPALLLAGLAAIAAARADRNYQEPELSRRSRFPIPDSRFPIPDSRFPIPDSPQGWSPENFCTFAPVTWPIVALSLT
jgi:hypothetical protein